MKGQNGLLNVQAKTVDQCKTDCLLSASCYGFDFQKTGFCLIYNMDFVNALTFNSQYDAYIRVRCINPQDITPTPGNICYQ